MSGSSERRWLVGCLALFVLLVVPFREYRTDDTFIFLRFAHNLARGDGPSFNPGEPVYGFSSPLWLLILTGLDRVGLGWLWSARIAAVVLAVVGILGFRRLAGQHLEPTWARAATLVWAANAWLVRWTAAAMETALFTTLVVWTLWRWEAERRQPTRRPLASLLAAFAVLARPEGLLLLGLVCLLEMRRGNAGGLRRAAPALVPIVPWLVYAWVTMGRLLPTTGAAKGHVGLAPALGPLVDVTRVITATSVVETLAILAGLLWLAGRRRDPEHDPAPHLLPLGWLLVLPLFYTLTDFDVLSRYALPVIPVVILYGFRAASTLPSGAWWRGFLTLAGATTAALLAWIGLAGRAGAVPLSALAAGVGGGLALALGASIERRRPPALAALAILLNVWVLIGVVHPHTRSFTHGVVDCFEGLGRWFAEHTPADAEVAIADVGAFGYYSGRRVIDLAGLMSPELIPLVDRLSIMDIAAGLEFADVARPGYLVDRHATPRRLEGTMGGVFEPLAVEPCAVEGLGVRSPSTVYYTAYRLHWERLETARDGGVFHDR